MKAIANISTFASIAAIATACGGSAPEAPAASQDKRLEQVEANPTAPDQRFEALPKIEIVAYQPHGFVLATVDFKARMQQYEADLIVSALEQTNGNQTEAAKRLGMPLRTLVHKIKVQGIRRKGYEPKQ